MSRNDCVTINGQRYNLHHNIQDFVKNTMKNLFDSNSISDDEIQLFLDKNYCKETFGLDFPILSTDKMAYASDKSHPRYYADEITTGMYLCNNWYDDRNADKFAEWLKKLSRS